MNKIIVFGKRKVGMSREEFIDRYENFHAPFGALYFDGLITDFKRYYPQALNRAALPGENPADLPSIDPPYDVVTVYSLRDEAAVAEFGRIFADPEVQRAFVADELTLLERDETRHGFCDVREGTGIHNA